MVKDHGLGEPSNLQHPGLTDLGIARGRIWGRGGAGSHHLCNFSVAASQGPLIKTEQNHHDHPGRQGGVAQSPFPYTSI